MRAVCALFSILVLATLTAAAAPLVSPRPMPRDTRPPLPPIASKVQAVSPTLRPRLRGQVQGVRVVPIEGGKKTATIHNAPPAKTDIYALATTPPVFTSPRPVIRPVHLNTSPRRVVKKWRRPVALVKTSPTAISHTGSVCQDRGIKGERLAPIHGKLSGCYVPEPVRVTSIDGITFSQKPIINCRTATTLAGWLRNSVKPAIRRRGGGLKSLSVPSHYSCRTRNSQPGAKLSEHAKGKAIDVSSFNLKDGSRITILDGWRNRRDHKMLKKLHDDACGPFGTVLGPDANKYHKDHFHFDVARYSGGAYCH